MFTGIITDIGRIAEVTRTEDLRARIATGYDTSRIELGASIASDGVCLTVTRIGPDWYEVFVSGETLTKTNLGGWEVGRRVNLERALKVGDELGGHIVTGHVDCVGELVGKREEGDSIRLTIRAPADYAPFIALKGSITVDGVSLTVNGVDDLSDGSCTFTLNIIPHTGEVTTLGALAESDRVNLEIDVLARYLKRMQALAG